MNNNTIVPTDPRHLPFRVSLLTIAMEEAFTHVTMEEWLYYMQEYGHAYYPDYYGYGWELPNFAACWSRYWLPVVTSFLDGDIKWINVYSHSKTIYHIMAAKKAVDSIDWGVLPYGEEKVPLATPYSLLQS